MTNWIATNTYDLANRRGKKFSRLNSKVMLSPYYVPEALRAYLDEKNIVIEFRYINISEPKEIFQETDGVTFEVGKKTDRIYKIRFDKKNSMTAKFSERYKDSLNSAFNSFMSQRSSDRASRKSRYSAAFSALTDNAGQIEKELQQVS